MAINKEYINYKTIKENIKFNLSVSNRGMMGHFDNAIPFNLKKNRKECLVKFY